MTSLGGIVRVTASLPGPREHFRSRVSLGDAQTNEDYDANIQIADLNALSASAGCDQVEEAVRFLRRPGSANSITPTPSTATCS